MKVHLTCKKIAAKETMARCVRDHLRAFRRCRAKKTRRSTGACYERDGPIKEAEVMTRS
jgi:hypothetical protein